MPGVSANKSFEFAPSPPLNSIAVGIWDIPKMRKSEIAKNQHYVPQFLLKNFTVGKKPQLWVFDKQTGKKFKTNIKNIASETKFYDFTFENVELTIEPALAEVEANASRIIKGIVKKEDISQLDDNDKIFFSHFLALQFTRTKEHRLRFQDLSSKMVEAIRERGFNPEEIEGCKELSEDDFKLHGIKSVFDSKKFALHFYTKTWLLFKTSKKQPLYISDNPITLQNRQSGTSIGLLVLQTISCMIFR